MHKSKCPACGSSHTGRNGKRKGIQTYKCTSCGYQFRDSGMPYGNQLWKLVFAQEAALGHAQHRLLPAIHLHLSAARLPRDAQHEQQNRRKVHRPQEQPEHTQRHVERESQVIHLWVFLGIGVILQEQKGSTLADGCRRPCV